MSNDQTQTPIQNDVGDPAVVVVWDPELVTEEQYAELIEAVGNVIRAHGGVGIQLLRASTYGASVEEGVTA